MAITTVATGDSSTVQLWQKKYFLEAYLDTFWSTYMDMDMGPVNKISDLEKGAGDTVRFDMFPRVDNLITDGNIEGHEANLSKYQETVVLNQYDVALRWRGELDEKRPAWDLEEVNQKQLKSMAAEQMDRLLFRALFCGAESSSTVSDFTKIFRPNARATKNALTATDLLDPQTIHKAAVWASDGGNQSGTRTQPPLSPIKSKGKSYWFLLVPNAVAYDFHYDNTYNEYLRVAAVRGEENPLFKDAKAIISTGVGEVVIVPCQRLSDYVTTNATSIPVARCALLGQQAVSCAFGATPRIIKRDFQYESQYGIDWRLIMGANRTVFNSLDWGVVGIDCAYTNIYA
jgi:N4-gp56 family major capsid protein